jgi:peptidoglycan/LPS O-acetylase OafA/YrhL
VSGQGPTFRTDLEGLRAIAVVLVLLYHARVPPFAGGYVGVDVFFVLSGFLITGLIVRELESTGRVSLSAFYARRARRLLPAAALVLLVTAIASAILLPPLQMPDVATDIASAAAYASNIRFALQATNYLASDVPPSPVLHYWSLGVEEQFYLVWPALLLLVAGAAFAVGQRDRGLRRLTVTFGAVFAGSLALAVWLTGVQQPWAFFSLPTRAWELALGGLLALPAAAFLGSPRWSPLLGWVGLGLVVASGVVLNDATPYPGIAALVPTLGSALVIASGLGAASVPAAAAGRRVPAAVGTAWSLPATVLSLPPVRYLGRISYSLYLWHWPVLVLPAAVLGDLPGVVRLGLAMLSVLLAAASQRWIEEPIRHGRLLGARPSRSLAMAAALSFVVAALSLSLGSRAVGQLRAGGPAVGGGVDAVNLPAPSPPTVVAGSASVPPSSIAPGSVGTLPPLTAAPVPEDLAPSLVAAKPDLPVIYSDGCHADPNATTPATGCVFGDSTSPTTVILFGDSHAAQWFPAFERLAIEHSWRLETFTKSACASADVNVWIGLYDRPYRECTAWRAAAFDRMAAEKPALVIVANDRNYTITIAGAMAYTNQHEDVWRAGLTGTIRRLRADGAAVVVIGDTVRQLEDPPDCLSSHEDDASACATAFDDAVAVAHQSSERAATEAAGATFIDPTGWMCFTDPCPSVIGRFLVYRDTHHMTATYARALSDLVYPLLPPLP